MEKKNHEYFKMQFDNEDEDLEIKIMECYINNDEEVTPTHEVVKKKRKMVNYMDTEVFSNAEQADVVDKK